MIIVVTRDGWIRHDSQEAEIVLRDFVGGDYVLSNLRNDNEVIPVRVTGDTTKVTVPLKDWETKAYCLRLARTEKSGSKSI